MPHWLEITLFIIFQLIMLVGLIGSVIPFFPGPLIMWLSVLGYAILTGWGNLGIFLFVIITLLFLVSIFVDNVLMGVGAHKGGASWLTIIVGLIAGIAGTILLPPFGGLVAAPLAIFLLEYLRVRDFRKAWKAFSGMVVGYGASYVVRFVIGLLIMGLWWLWVWKG